LATIIRMTSDEFIKKFIKKEDYKKYNFLLVSDDISTNKSYDNVYSIKALLPPPNVMTVFIQEGCSNKYREKYFKYLSNPRVEALITVIVKLAVVDNSDVILLCSKNESEFKYVSLICEYIKAVYGVDTCSYKKYNKNRKKYDNIKHKKSTLKILKKKLKNIKEVPVPQITRSEMYERLKSMDKQQLRSICKQNSITYSKDDSRKDLIDVIMDVY